MPRRVATLLEKGERVVNLQDAQTRTMDEKINKLYLSREAEFRMLMGSGRSNEEEGEEQHDELRDWDWQDRWECSHGFKEEQREYYDEISGENLPRLATEAARWEEIEFMKEWKVWDVVPVSQSYK